LLLHLKESPVGTPDEDAPVHRHDYQVTKDQQDNPKRIEKHWAVLSEQMPMQKTRNQNAPEAARAFSTNSGMKTGIVSAGPIRS
jgi:hypothetical protein